MNRRALSIGLLTTMLSGGGHSCAADGPFECIFRVRTIIAEHLGVDPDKVILQARLVRDLGADSLTLVELTLALELEFGVRISGEVCEKFVTVEDIVLYLRKVGRGPPNYGPGCQ